MRFGESCFDGPRSWLQHFCWPSSFSARADRGERDSVLVRRRHPVHDHAQLRVRDPGDALLREGSGGLLRLSRRPGATYPAPGDIYWLHIYVAGMGNVCSGGSRVSPQVVLPAYTSLAIDASHKITCCYANGSLDAGDCPSGLATGGTGGALIIPSPDTAHARTWPVPQGATWEWQIPVVSDRPLTNSPFGAYLVVADGNSNPTLGLAANAYVFAKSPAVTYPSPATTGWATRQRSPRRTCTAAVRPAPATSTSAQPRPTDCSPTRSRFRRAGRTGWPTRTGRLREPPTRFSNRVRPTTGGSATSWVQPRTTARTRLSPRPARRVAVPEAGRAAGTEAGPGGGTGGGTGGGGAGTGGGTGGGRVAAPAGAVAAPEAAGGAGRAASRPRPPRRGHGRSWTLTGKAKVSWKTTSGAKASRYDVRYRSASVSGGYSAFKTWKSKTKAKSASVKVKLAGRTASPRALGTRTGRYRHGAPSRARPPRLTTARWSARALEEGEVVQGDCQDALDQHDGRFQPHRATRDGAPPGRGLHPGRGLRGGDCERRRDEPGHVQSGRRQEDEGRAGIAALASAVTGDVTVTTTSGAKVAIDAC